MITHAVNPDDDMSGQRFNQDAFKKGDHRPQWKALCPKWKAFFLRGTALAAAAVFVLAPAARAQGEAWRVWLEPKFMKAAVTAPLAGSKHVELAAGWHAEDADGGDFLLNQARFEALGVDKETFFAKARANADALLAGLTPRLVRDQKKVIEYAILSSERPVVAAAVLSPKFLERFRDTLGETVLVVVPNRYRAFVFPALASNYRQYAPLVLGAYRATAFPVGLEVFEVSSTGWKAVGIFEE